MKDPVLQVDLSAGYGRQVLLENLRFELAAGERLGLLGSSGEGKSTLVLAILGLLHYRGGWTRGRVVLDGEDLLSLSARAARSLRGQRLALVPQSAAAAMNPALSIERHFVAAWRAHKRSDGHALQERRDQLMNQVSLPRGAEFLKRKPGQISVGQAQRCAIALALLHRPRVLLADEPTSALDPETQVEVLQLLREASEQSGTALLFVSHDLLSVLRLCQQVAMLSGRKIAECLPTNKVATATNPMLRRLLGTLPVPAELLLRHMQHLEPEITREPTREATLTPTL